MRRQTAPSSVARARWQKCAWNTVFNPISALGGGLGTRDILASEATTQFVKETIAEVCAIARASGHPLADDTVEKQIQGTLRMPNYVSSMGQDLLAGRPMETEALLGNAVRIARRLSVPAPRLEALYALLLASFIYVLFYMARRAGEPSPGAKTPGGLFAPDGAVAR